MVDVCAWCECFSRHRLSPAAAAAATAYLFKVPEGAALGATGALGATSALGATGDGGATNVGSSRDGNGVDAPDPGFFYQMKTLHDTLASLTATTSGLAAVEGTVEGAVEGTVVVPTSTAVASKTAGTESSAQQPTTGPSPTSGRSKPGVVCAGLACLDMQLIGATKTKDPQAVNAFQQVSFCAGGSAPQVSRSMEYTLWPTAL